MRNHTQAAREAARQRDGRFGEQPLPDPGAAVLPAASDDVWVTTGPTPPCMVTVEVWGPRDGVDQPVGTVEFDATGLLATLPITERLRLVNECPEDLYTLAAQHGLVQNWTGPVTVLHVDKLTAWVDQNRSLRIGNDTFVEGWLHNGDLMITSISGRGADAARARAAAQVERLRKHSWVVTFDDPEANFTIMPCPDQAAADEIVDRNGATDPETGEDGAIVYPHHDMSEWLPGTYTVYPPKES